MTDETGRDWLDESRRHNMTDVYERALRAAAGIIWQRLGTMAAGGAMDFGRDYFDPGRTVIAEYLRHTGRVDEAQQVLAIGCNEPPPPTGFTQMTASALAKLRDTLKD